MKHNQSMRHSRKKTLRLIPGISERGAAFVELAVVIPLLVGLLFGALEFGAAWRESALLQRTASQTARTISSLGTNPNADRQALTSVAATIQSSNRLELLPDTTDRVVVYNASGGENGDPLSAPPEACLTTTALKIDGVCNIYPADAQNPEIIFQALDQYSSSQLYEPSQCTTPYDGWCGTQRSWFTSTPTAQTPYVGVYIQATYTTITGAFSNRQISANAIYQMEPCTVIRQNNEVVNLCPI